MKRFSSVGSLCGQTHVDIPCKYQSILLFAVFLYGGKRKIPWAVCWESENQSKPLFLRWPYHNFEGWALLKHFLFIIIQ